MQQGMRCALFGRERVHMMCCLSDPLPVLQTRLMLRSSQTQNGEKPASRAQLIIMTPNRLRSKAWQDFVFSAIGGRVLHGLSVG